MNDFTSFTSGISIRELRERQEHVQILTVENCRYHLDCTAAIANHTNDFVFEIYRWIPCGSMQLLLEGLQPRDNGPLPVAMSKSAEVFWSKLRQRHTSEPLSH